MKKLMLTAAVTCFLSTAAATLCAQGEFPLKYSEAEASDSVAMLGGQVLESLPERPPELKALPPKLSSNVRYFRIPVAGKAVVAVLDASPRPRLFVDAAGTGDLSGAAPAASTAQESRPVALRIPGAKDDATVKARFFVQGVNLNYLVVLPAGYMAGEVRLAGQSCRVALVDRNLDGRYDGMLGLPLSPSSPPTYDIFAITPNQRSNFEYSSGDVLPLLPMFHMRDGKGAYYRMQVAPDGSSIRMEKFEPQMGTLDVGSPVFQLALLSTAGFHTLTGSEGKWQVPAGRYTAASLTMPVCLNFRRTDLEGAEWILTAYGNVGKLEAFEIRPGETLSLKVGPPLAGKTSVTKLSDGTLSIAFVLVGQAGEEYAPGVQKNGKRVPAPKFKILDESGKVLAAGQFEYG